MSVSTITPLVAVGFVLGLGLVAFGRREHTAVGVVLAGLSVVTFLPVVLSFPLRLGPVSIAFPAALNQELQRVWATLLAEVTPVNLVMGLVLAVATLVVVTYVATDPWRTDPANQSALEAETWVVVFGLLLLASGLFARFYYTVPGWGTYYDVLSLWFGLTGVGMLVLSPLFGIYFFFKELSTP